MDLDSAPAQLWTAESPRKDFSLPERTFEHSTCAPTPLVYRGDSAASTPCPRAVVPCVVDVYRRSYAKVHRGRHRLTAEVAGVYEASRDKARQYLNARSAHEIVFISGMTHAINLTGRDHHAMASQFDGHGVGVCSGCQCTRPLHHRLGLSGSVRVSFCAHTTGADIDRLAAALAETAIEIASVLGTHDSVQA